MITIPIRVIAVCASAFFALATGMSQAAERTLVSPEGKPGGLLYVAVDNQLRIYRQDGAGPIGRITKGINGPTGLAVDSAGTLYVANATGRTVTVYPVGTRSPSLVLSKGLQQPMDVAVGADGTVYVANDATGSSTGTVVEYRAGQTKPFFTTPPYNPSGQLSYFSNDAVDANEDVFVSASFGSSFGEGVLEYPAGASSWEFLLGPGYLRNSLTGLAVDRWGHLVVGEEGGISAPGQIEVVDVAQGQVLRTIATPYAGVDVVRLDRDSFQVFASDPSGATIDVYAYQSGKFVRNISIAGNFIDGIAVGPAAR